MPVNVVAEHLGHMPRCCIPREIDPAFVFVFLDQLGEHAKHLSCVFARAVEVGNLIQREFERGGHDENALRFLILRHSGHFTGSYQCSAALSTNGEETELIDGEERLIFLKLGENAPDVVHFFPIFGVGRRHG